uniref:Spaetzle domain-containing protein n=1 Tax=Panagrolaimus sp. PS1159 TaxID=55785 RepID=A0AC35GSM5_9BILA
MVRCRGRLQPFWMFTAALFLISENIQYLTATRLESDRWIDFDVTKALPSELRDYKKHLNTMLEKVDTAISDYEKLKSKRFIPISSTIPDDKSAFILDRVESLTNEKQKNHSLPLPETLAAASTDTSTQFSPLPAQHYASRQYYGPFNPTQNRSMEECRRLSQAELVTELKQKGTYNPDLMAWDATGIFRFLDRSIVDQYEKQTKSKKSSNQAVERNVEALERLLAELNLQCNVRNPAVLSKLQNLTITEPRRTVMSPSIRMTEDEIRVKRHTVANEWIQSFNSSRLNDDFMGRKKQRLIGDVHVVPFGCDKRGEQEDGYLRLCGACQAIRKLPDTFFPPFINEVMCDEDKACLYFYDYPHGKCKQKHMNFVVLRNVGTQQCQVWQKFNLNVRVSCECFVDEMSFFAKYV